MNKSVMLFLGMLLVSGCVKTLPIETPPVPYIATKKNLNPIGSTTLTVRAMKKTNDTKAEVTGVPCTLQADGFGSKFVTPANVVTPNLQSRMPVASVTCTLDGVAKSTTLNPINETIADIHARNQSAASGGGLIGAVVGAVAANAQIKRRDAGADIYGYSDVTVTFE